jgi:uncharacterized protein (DUF3084 family)
MQGVLLILYMLVVSGLIAVVGDRVGYRIGKKRLTWFNLRPRHTAILVAVVTGVSISALTLGTLLLLNRSLSEALFSYTNQIAQAEQELRALNRQKALLEAENAALRVERDHLKVDLDQFRTQQSAAQTRLSEVRDQLAVALQERQEAEAKLAAANEQLAKVQPSLDRAHAELEAVKAEVESARQVIATLESQKQALQLDRDQLERSLDVVQAALTQLENQKNQLEQEIEQLNQLAVRLRRGELAILAGEVLATGVVEAPRGAKPEAIRRQFEHLLAQAEQRALALGSQPMPPLENAILIRREDADQALEKLQEPGSWAVRILSLTNRLKGEPCACARADLPQPADLRQGIRAGPRGDSTGFERKSDPTATAGAAEPGQSALARGGASLRSHHRHCGGVLPGQVSGGCAASPPEHHPSGCEASCRHRHLHSGAIAGEFSDGRSFRSTRLFWGSAGGAS